MLPHSHLLTETESLLLVTNVHFINMSVSVSVLQHMQNITAYLRRICLAWISRPTVALLLMFLQCYHLQTVTAPHHYPLLVSHYH